MSLNSLLTALQEELLDGPTRGERQAVRVRVNALEAHFEELRTALLSCSPLSKEWNLKPQK